MRIPLYSGRQKQTGAATLLVSVVLLVSATLIVFVASRSLLTEQRISANEVRAKQALSAAQAGLDHAFAYVADGGLDHNNDGALDVITASYNSLPNGSKYSVKYCRASTYLSPLAPLPDCPSTPGAPTCTAAGSAASPFIIQSCGWSADNSASQMVVQIVAQAPVVASPPTNPLVSLGAVNVSGSATVTNYYNNLSVWSGQSLQSIGNSGKTFVKNPTDATVPTDNTTPPDPPTNCGTSTNYVCTTDKSKTGPDVVDRDLGLQGLTGGEFFRNFFGMYGDAYKATVSSSNLISAGDFGTLNNTGGQVNWVDGNVSGGLGNMTIGVPAPNYSIADTEDSRYWGKPSVVIIDGDFNASGNLTVNGILYIGGNANISGNIRVNGVAIVQGNVTGNGSLDVVYNPRTVKGAANRTGAWAYLPGGWRDWK